MFILDYIGFKHVKYYNIFHILTFYTTPIDTLVGRQADSHFKSETIDDRLKKEIL